MNKPFFSFRFCFACYMEEGISEWRLGIVACFGFFLASFFFHPGVRLHLGLLLNVCFFFLLPFSLRIVDWLLFH